MAIGLYPAIEPDDHGMLEVGDGHRVYWETCGNPAGKPAVALHGGPGSGCAPWWRRLLDPSAYRIVCLDQRGCGRSTPNAGAPTADLGVNTTDHLLTDLERLRRRLEIDRWLVLGGSWGSTLALAYAEAHPEQVSELVVFSVVTTTRPEVLWITRDMGRLYPREWEQFRAGAPEAGADDLVAAYAMRLVDPDPFVRHRAARRWCAWEDTHMRGHGDQLADPGYGDPAFRMCFARLVTHYWHHTAWRRDGELLEGVERLASVPAVLIHGRRDLSSPLDVPWQLTRRWPGSELVVVDDAGHSAHALADAVVTATDRFATPR